VIIDLPDTDTGAVARELVELRESGGAVALGRVLTLIIVTDDARPEEAIRAANDASREHPCRIIAVIRGNRRGSARLDAQVRIGGDAGASEVIVLRLYGPLVDHGDSCVVPFLLPDAPVVAWWPGIPPDRPSEDPIGRMAQRRITDAAVTARPMKSLEQSASWHVPGDTDLAWSRITYWRAMLTSALDQGPHEPIQSAVVSGLKTEPALDILAGWLASRIDGPVQRAVGELKVELVRNSETITLSRPQEGVTATLTRTAKPDALLPLARRETRECLAEDMRRLDADEIYLSALQGIDRVQYLPEGSQS
jgi:glucose-6-phosphate dehydrogenase assembly protein OpcA